MSKTPKTLAEFFAGIGLVREGLEPSGWQTVYANDICPHKHRLYKDRFGESREFHLEDVWNVDSVVGMFRRRFVPFLATASFPCTDVSLAGKKVGIEGQHSSAFFAFAKVLRVLQTRKIAPKMVTIENVPGLYTGNGGAGFVAVVEELSSLGYWLDAFVLNASDFVPQNRPRVFIVGWRSGRPIACAPVPWLVPADGEVWAESASRPEYAWCRPAKMAALLAKASVKHRVLWNVPRPPERTIRLEDVLDLSGSAKWWPPDRVQKFLGLLATGLQRERLDAMIAGSEITIRVGYREGCGVRVRSDSLAGCVVARAGGGAPRGIVVLAGRSGIRMRDVTVAECAALQGARSVSSESSQAQQTRGYGDAVCVPVVSWIDQHVLTPAFNAVAGNPATLRGNSHE